MSYENIKVAELPFVLLRDRQLLPEEPGIYFVVTKGRIIYIGQSINIRRRWQTHGIYALVAVHPQPCIAWLLMPCEGLDSCEDYFTEKFKPLLDGSKTRRRSCRYKVIKTRPEIPCYVVAYHANFDERRLGLDWSLRVVLARKKMSRTKFRHELYKRFQMDLPSKTINRWYGLDSVPDDIESRHLEAIVSVLECHPDELINPAICR